MTTTLGAAGAGGRGIPPSPGPIASPPAFGAIPPTAQLVLMEGPLKKRGANLPVMRDRYCVATWEAPPPPSTSSASSPHGPSGSSPIDGGAKVIVLRTYKTSEQQRRHPERPVSMHVLKCVSEWDGKGNFHHYPHAFTMETDEHKLFHCSAPTAGAKTQWLELMTSVLTPRTVIDEPVPRSNSSHGPSQSPGPDFEEFDGWNRHGRFPTAPAPAPVMAEAEDARYAAPEDVFGDDPSDEYDEHDDADWSEVDDDDEQEGERQPAVISPVDERVLFRASSGSLLGSDDDNTRRHRQASTEDRHQDEPKDWGIYGEDDEHGTARGISRYDIVDDPVVLLDKDLLLLNGAAKAPPLASDDFLFEQNGPTFGAVEVRSRRRNDELDADELVDEGLVERMERRKKEKERQRVTKKLESNKDLYAEMAAARLRSMRKDARQHPRRSVSHHRRDEWSELNDNEDDAYSESEQASVTTEDLERLRGSVSVSRSGASDVSRDLSAPAEDIDNSVTRSSDLDENEASAIGDEDQKPKKSKRRAQREEQRLDEPSDDAESQHEVSFAEDLLFGDASVPMSAPSDHPDDAMVTPLTEDVLAGEAEAEVEERRRRKELKKKAKREAAKMEAEALALADAAARREAEEARRRLEEEAEAEEQRLLEKQRRKEERRARKEKQRREEEAAAAAAEELARQQREAQRKEEEEELARQERRERKERKKQKEKNALEKKAKLLKQREAELLAEAEKLKQTQEALKVEEEKKDRKKKRRDKYTSPVERILRREQEAEALASEMSNALVLVETPAPLSKPTPDTAVSVAAPAAETPIAAQQSVEPVLVTSVPPSTSNTTADKTATSAPALAAPAPVPVAAAPTVAIPTPPLSAPAALATELPSSGATPTPTPTPTPSTTQPPLSVPLQFPLMAATSPYYHPAYPGAPTMPYATVPGSYPTPYAALPPYPGYAPMPFAQGVPMAASPYYPHLGYVSGIVTTTAPPPTTTFGPDLTTMSTATTTAGDQEPTFIGPSLPSPSDLPNKHNAAPTPTTASTAAAAATTTTTVTLPDLPDVVEF